MPSQTVAPVSTATVEPKDLRDFRLGLQCSGAYPKSVQFEEGYGVASVHTFATPEAHRAFLEEKLRTNHFRVADVDREMAELEERKAMLAARAQILQAQIDQLK